jgi:tetratricopeptide (TPR) repeat protein
MPAPLAIDSASSTEQELVRLRGLQQAGRHAEALEGATALLRDRAQDRDLLLIAASSLRRMLRIPEAMALIDRLETLEPRLSLLHQERGLCYVALKDAQNAIASLLRAVSINPALPMSWRMLQGVYRLNGDEENAATAAAHLDTLARLPPEVVTATSLFSDGELARAEQITRAFLLTHGDDPEAMRLLAKIGVAHDVLDDAETLLEAVLVLSPGYRAARFDYAQVLVKRQKFGLAREEANRLLGLEPANFDYRSLAATIAIGLGEHERALELYGGMLADAPGDPDIHLWRGHALKTIGRTPEAIDAYLAAAGARADFGDAYWSLANLKTYPFPDVVIERMRAAESAPATAAEDRVHLCFALGKALEDQGEITESWSYYGRGNAMRRAESRYRPEIIENNTAKQIEVCTRAFFTDRARWGAKSAEPIFIVGLPRSGSTLIEQILASHSAIEGTQELPEVQRIVIELQGRDPDLDDPRYPAALANLTRDDFARLGERYLAEAEAYRSGKPVFIDKMPNNFRHVGLIHLMLPNATIIDARREPMACCFSNLKQLFANGQEFAYSIDDIARYYRTYLELMAHWDAVLPGRVLRVSHEDLVDDLEGGVRRLLDHCRLPFEQSCVDFHLTERSVRTPSSEQVRQPIFREGLDQWRKYEPWLEPLKAALGDALVRYRDEPATAPSSVSR